MLAISSRAKSRLPWTLVKAIPSRTNDIPFTRAWSAMSEMLRTDFCVRLTNSTRFIFNSSLNQFCCVHNQIRFGCQQYVQPVEVETKKTYDCTHSRHKTKWNHFMFINPSVDVMCQGWLVIDLFLFPNTPVFEQQNNRCEDKD